MKRFALVALLLVTISVAATPMPALQPQDKPKPADDADLKELVKGNNEFAFDLYALLSKEKGNIVFSPYSISTALAMTYAGARGKTAEEMAKVLHFTLPQERLHAACGQLITDLQKNDKERAYQLHVANALWGQKGLPFVNEFLELTRKNYDAGFREIDFKADPDEACRIINRWVEEKTKDKIKNLLLKENVHKTTKLILTNAIYFKSAWQLPFPDLATMDRDFHLAKGQKVKARTMHHLSQYAYAEDDKVQLLEISYRSDELSFFVLLPKQSDGLGELEATLSPTQIATLLDRRKSYRVDLALPKFETLCEFRKLRDDFIRLGINEAFYDQANFSGVYTTTTQGPRFILSDVIHKAYIGLDEKGTEAAAATAVVGVIPISNKRPTIAPPEIVFTADHPFFFIIRDNRSGSFVFMGRVVNPTQKQ